MAVLISSQNHLPGLEGPALIRRAKSRRPLSSAWLAQLSALSLLLALSGCSIKRLAMNEVGNALAGSDTSFASDDDPELVADAIPFTLKLVESILEEVPDHKRLRTAAAAYFTQYAFGFIQLEADYVEVDDFERAEAMRERARKLFLRARNHGLYRIELDHPNFSESLADDPQSAVSGLEKELIETIYWTAAAWGSAITLGKTDPFLVSEIPQMEALIDHALTLDPNWNHGAIHGFLTTYEMSRQVGRDDPIAASRAHFEQAIEASESNALAPYVALAEAVCIQTQDVEEFQSLLETALEIDIDAAPANRLENLLMKKRAEWLLEQKDELFLPDDLFQLEE